MQVGRSRVRFPDGVIGIFHPSGRIVALGSNRNEYQECFLEGGKGGRCVGLIALQYACAECLEIWNPQSLSRPVMGLLYLYTSDTAV